MKRTFDHLEERRERGLLWIILARLVAACESYAAT